VSACNRPPVANDDSAGTLRNTPVTVNVVANDVDPDNDTLTVTSATTPAHGTTQVVSSGSVKYTPATGYVGPDTFNYTINDGHGHTASAKVTITVSNTANGSPDAVNDSAATQQDTPVTIGVLDNDSDPDGDALTVTNVSDPPHGAAAINPNNTVTYTPDNHYFGSDSFTYTISDGRGGTDTATVGVTVNRPANRAPDAVDDSATTQQSTAVTINVLGNDSDPDGDPLTVTAVSDPPHGTAVRNADNSVTYTPDGGYSGGDGFTYTIGDGRGGTDTANVSVFVEPAAASGDKKVEGGGWIADSNGTDGKASFGFNAEQKDAKPAKGRISFDNGKGGIGMKGTVERLVATGPTKAAKSGHGELNGSCELRDGRRCTYAVQVDDNGEKGAGSDRFSIQIYDLTGTLIYQNSGLLGGGNIKVQIKP
jgi:hypothetical protein